MIFGALAKNKNLEAQLKIPLTKKSAKLRFLAILKIICKNIKKWRRCRKKCKVHFLENLELRNWRFLEVFMALNGSIGFNSVIDQFAYQY